jgi:hypothetical protein
LKILIKSSDIGAPVSTAFFFAPLIMINDAYYEGYLKYIKADGAPHGANNSP